MLSLLGIFAYKIEKPKVRVTYLLTNYKSGSDLPKVKVNNLDKDGKIIEGMPDSMSLNDMGVFNFNVDIEVIADEKSAEEKHTINHPGMRGGAASFFL